MTERQRIASGSPFEPTIGFSRAMRVGDRVLVSGTGPVVPDGRCPDDAGAPLDDVVRTRMYLTSADVAAAVGSVHGELFADVRPAATMIVVAGLLDPAWKVEIEAEAVAPPR
jgi:enamine deaminase RidA (YjgF/YER057c/UK114 family)